MNDGYTRRDLLKTAVGGALAGSLAQGADAAEKLPTRVLGKTGVRVPILGFGTAPTGVKREQKDAVALYNLAIDLGVTYLDTAPDFTGYGKAQEHLGHVLKERRKEVFLVTKLHEPDRDKALQLLEKNLKELQTDHADLVYAHSIGADKMDLPTVMGKHGTMAALEHARKEGLTQFVGISGHNRPDKFLSVLERFEIDVMMNAVNFADQFTYGFDQKVWPVAARKKVGLVAMKVFGGMGNDKGFSSSALPVAHVPLALRYALSVPNVSLAVIGMATEEELRKNVALARAFKPLSAQEQAEAARLGKEFAAKWGEHFGPAAA